MTLSVLTDRSTASMLRCPIEWPTGETCLIHIKGIGALNTQELIRFIQACREDGRPEAVKLAEEAERRLSEREIIE